MLEVVSAVLLDAKGRILLQQRPEGKDYAGLWETPGGKVEGDESHHQTIERELKEELSIDVQGIAMSSMWCGRIPTLWKTPTYLLFYFCDWKGPVVPREGQGWGFFYPHVLNSLELTPGTHAAKDAIIRMATYVQRMKDQTCE